MSIVDIPIDLLAGEGLTIFDSNQRTRKREAEEIARAYFPGPARSCDDGVEGRSNAEIWGPVTSGNTSIRLNLDHLYANSVRFTSAY